MRRTVLLTAILMVVLAFIRVGLGKDGIFKFENGIWYLDIDDNGIKDVVICGEYSTPLGGNIYKACSFYLRTKEGKLFYIPIPAEDNKGSEVSVYTYSKVGGCGSRINKEEITNLSSFRLIKLNSGVYLILAKKDCKSIEKMINNKCPFNVVIFKYDEEDKAFLKYKTYELNKLYCDSEEVFKNENEILKLLDKGR